MKMLQIAAVAATSVVLAVAGTATAASAAAVPPGPGPTPTPIPLPGPRSVTIHAATENLCQLQLQFAVVTEGTWTSFPWTIETWDDNSMTTFGTKSTLIGGGTSGFADYESYCYGFNEPACIPAGQSKNGFYDCGPVEISWRNVPGEQPWVHVSPSVAPKWYTQHPTGVENYDDQIIID